MKFGDVVILVEGDQAYPALVLASRIQDSLAGPEGKEVLDLGLFRPVPGFDAGGKRIDQPVLGTSRQNELVHFHFGVPHVSVGGQGSRYVETPTQIVLGVGQFKMVPPPVEGESEQSDTNSDEASVQ